MQLLRNRADWCNWAEGLAGISIRHSYNVPPEPSIYPCYGYAALVIREAGYETEEAHYLYAADMAAMTLTLLERAA